MDNEVVSIADDNQYLHKDDLILKDITLERKEDHKQEIKENIEIDFGMESKDMIGNEDKSKHNDNGVIKNISYEIKTSALGDQINEMNSINNEKALVNIPKDNPNNQLNDLNKMDPDKNELTTQKTSLDKNKTTTLSMESSNDSRTSQVPEHSKAETLESKSKRNEELSYTIENNKVTRLKDAESDDNGELEYSHLDDILDNQLNSINNNIVVSKSDDNYRKNYNGETIETTDDVVMKATNKNNENDEININTNSKLNNQENKYTGDIKNTDCDNENISVDGDNEKSTGNNDDMRNTVDDDDEKSAVDVNNEKATVNDDDKKTTVDDDDDITYTVYDDDEKSTVDVTNDKSAVDDDDKEMTVDDENKESTVDNDRDTDNDLQSDRVIDKNTTLSNVDDEESIIDIENYSDDEVLREKQDVESSSDYDSDVDYMALALQFIEREPVVKVERSEFFSCQLCHQAFLGGHAYELHCLTHVKIQKTQLPDQLKKAKNQLNELYKPIHYCPDCDASFVQISTLQVHATLHAPKPNICRCGIEYYRKEDLLGHIKVVHDNNVEEWLRISENTNPKKRNNKENNRVFKTNPKIQKYNESRKGFECNKEKEMKVIYKDDDYENDDSDKGSVVSNWASRHKRKKDKKKHKKKRNDDNLVDMLCPEVGINESDRCLCTVCNKTFLNKRTYTAHAIRHKPRNHPCEKCGKKFVTEKELQKHIDDHVRNVCTVCNKEIASKTGLKIHMRIHTGDRPYACTHKNCTKRFTQMNALKNHLLVHSGERNFKCSFCDKAFVQISSLQAHEGIHMNLKQYRCRYCDKGFNDRSAFARHERTHTGDKRYKCPQCPMAFTDASGFIVHKRRHTGQRDYKCTQCSKSFFIKNDLKQHEFLHTKQTAVECNICGLKFALKQYLKLHIKVMHVETKKVACKLCKKMLKPFYMDKHMVDVHDINTKSKRVNYFSDEK